MDYKLFINEKINEGVKRITVEQISGSVEELNRTGKNFDDAIHEARKYFKKIRAVIRLVRFELGHDLYKRENILFRDTGRLLSRIRDAAVMAESVKNLKKEYPDEFPDKDYKELRRELGKRAAKVRKDFKKNTGLINAVKEKLEGHINEVKNWELPGNDFDILEKGLKQVYERGLTGLKKASENPSAANFHEWRKRVKYLWYHSRILEQAWPETLQAYSDKLDSLSDLLGLEHDFAELRNLLIKDPSLSGNSPDIQKVFVLIGQERLKLQTEAKSLSGYIYNETPGQFVNRIKIYWNQSRDNYNNYTSV